MTFAKPGVMVTLLLLSLPLGTTAGCESDPSGRDRKIIWHDDSRAVQTDMSSRSPALIFSTEATNALLAEGGWTAGFAAGDWEYARRDGALPVGDRAGPGWSVGFFSVTQTSIVREWAGRPRSYGRTEVRSHTIGGSR